LVIPDEISQLANLKILELARNQIEVIPEAVAQSTSLTILDLEDNKITTIPLSIKLLPNLDKLDLRGNPISIPKEILNSAEKDQYPTAKPILDYYFTTRDPNQTQIVYEAKLLLVGEGGVGKTSLANKLLDPDYELKPETEDTSTQGIDILDWAFTGTNGKEYKIHIWDFGGQEIYHQTHQFFLTERACYLLVADDRRENTDHYFWLQSIQLLGKNSPVHLIQNEKGDRGCNLNPNQLRGEFANLRDTHRTNLADNRGLSALKTALQREIEALIPHGIPFPNKWLAVRYSLENNNRNYIDISEYIATCQRHEISDRDEMHNLSRFLHDLGIVLHFQKDPILRQRLILKPNWGTTAIYKILDNPTVKTNLGQFSDSDLETIWADSQYNDMRHELLQLMKEFKVCYEIPRRNGQYIAPHLLATDTPTYPPLTDNPLILRYKYKNFMPKGILTRFIVEMHRDIENASDPANAAVWKTGVVLTKGSTRAEIIEHYNQCEIHIRVVGSRPRDFLTIINQKIEEIHERFYGDAIFEPDPPYETLIPCNCPTCKPSPEPYTFALNLLHDWIDEGRFEIQCYRKGTNVNIRGLIDGVIVENSRNFEDSPEEFLGKSRYDRATRRRRRPNPETAVTPVIIENHIHNTSQQEQTVTNDKNYTWTGDKVAGNKMQIDTVHGDAVAGNKIVNSQNLAQAAQDIKALIAQLANDYDTTTPTGKRKLSDRILETLEGDSTIQNRALNALKEAGKTAFEEAIDHPIAKVLVAGLEGYLEG
jgi:internalin A